MHNERSPLLGTKAKDAGSDQSKWTSIYLLSICVFFLCASDTLLSVPLTQLIEDNICRQDVKKIMDLSLITEGFCKNDHIQTKLAYTTSSLPVVEAIVGLITAFPFGVLADRIGQKPVIYLSVIGTMLCMSWELIVLAFPGTLPARLIVAGPLFLVVGGGFTVQVSLTYSIACNLADSSNRASAFFVIEFAGLLGNTLGPVIASNLMQATSPWIPALISIFLAPISLISLSFIPETHNASEETFSKQHNLDQTYDLKPHTIKSHLSQSFHLFNQSLASLKSNSIIIILATGLIRMPEFIGTSQFLAQYISKRFNWSLAETGYLLTLRGMIHMVVLLLALPILSTILLRWQSSNRRDLTLARISTGMAAMGMFWMAASRIDVVVMGLAIQSLGAGMGPLCRSLANGYVSQQETSNLNTLMGILQTGGSLFGGPALAWLFDVGMGRGGMWVGLPYFGLTGAFLLCFVGLLFVNAPAGSGDDEDHDIQFMGDIDHNSFVVC
ncbi:Major facilitator superfamily domain general substrate transporter [Penicillium angulare]|uniref:Major facilitator superfamily domain general substrate transporter n=1 Tax=Penicillium angulare TaxID=116970 RepID=A0A9W9FVB8_9EURO|nr:Major facilitator superfamily domain general substrate transporter [Penicillium angulare]